MPFQLGFEQKKATTKTKLSYQTLESVIFQFFFKSKLNRNKQRPKPIYFNQKLEVVIFQL